MSVSAVGNGASPPVTILLVEDDEVIRKAVVLQERLLVEQRFTADVAHELRTPLMGLVTSAGLLPESEATELVRDRMQVLRVLVEDLLEISRLDAGVERLGRARVIGAALALSNADDGGATATLRLPGTTGPVG